MKSTKIYFSLLVTASFLVSCSDDPVLSKKDLKSEITVKSYFEDNYESLVQPMAEVFGNNSSISELISFSELPNNGGEAEINLSKLIKNEYPVGSRVNQRSSSTILNRIRQIIGNPDVQNKRATNSSPSLMDFILKNDIEVYAPYLAENFKGSLLKSLTITYYYPGMYGDKENDPSFKGETPGYRYTFNADGTLNLNDSEPVITNDEYAMVNPTIVILPNESVYDESVWGIRGVDNNAKKKNDETRVLNTPLCNELSPQNEILTVRMPKIKLRENIRRWPNPNEMYLWVAMGEFSTGGTGTSNINVNTSMPLAGLRISRSDATDKTWVSSSTSFIVQNWKYESQNMHLVWGCTRSESTLTSEVTVSVKDDGTATPQFKTTVVTRDGVELVTSTIYDKCAVLYNNRYDVNQGANFYDGYPVYHFNNIWVYFTFDKYNY